MNLYPTALLCRDTGCRGGERGHRGSGAPCAPPPGSEPVQRGRAAGAETRVHQRSLREARALLLAAGRGKLELVRAAGVGVVVAATAFGRCFVVCVLLVVSAVRWCWRCWVRFVGRLGELVRVVTAAAAAAVGVGVLVVAAVVLCCRCMCVSPVV